MTSVLISHTGGSSPVGPFVANFLGTIAKSWIEAKHPGLKHFPHTGLDSIRGRLTHYTSKTGPYFELVLLRPLLIPKNICDDDI